MDFEDNKNARLIKFTEKYHPDVMALAETNRPWPNLPPAAGCMKGSGESGKCYVLLTLVI